MHDLDLHDFNMLRCFAVAFHSSGVLVPHKQQQLLWILLPLKSCVGKDKRLFVLDERHKFLQDFKNRSFVRAEKCRLADERTAERKSMIFSCDETSGKVVCYKLFVLRVKAFLLYRLVVSLEELFIVHLV